MSVQNVDKATRARSGKMIAGKLAMISFFAASVFVYYVYFFK